MTTYSQMGQLFEQGKLTPQLEDLYVQSATPTGTTSPSVVTNPNYYVEKLKRLTDSAVSNPFDWFVEGTHSALAAAEALLTNVYEVSDYFTDSVTGEIRNAKGEVTKAKGKYANLAKTLALAGAIGGGYSYLSGKKEQLESETPGRTVNAKKKVKGKSQNSGKRKSKPKRL